jgi:hypothetical protein
VNSVLALVAALAVGAPGDVPRECDQRTASARSNVWERAKTPGVRAYCAKLASAAARLLDVPPDVERVVALADDALALLPARGAPHAMKGRAYVATGRLDEALSSFGAAERSEPDSVAHGRTLREFARALLLADKTDAARPRYLRLATELDGFTVAERAGIQIEAGLVMATTDPIDSESALSFFVRAQEDSDFEMASAAAFFERLVRSRRKDFEPPRPRPGPEPDPRAVFAPERLGLLFGPVGQRESLAASALALESRDAAAARALWQEYVQVAHKRCEPCRAHAQGRITSGPPAAKTK